MNEEIIRLLDAHNWKESILKLTAYAVSLCGILNSAGRLTQGLEPEDLVMEAIEKVYRGDRRWDPEKDPDLHRYLMSVVKSILSNTLTLSETHILSGLLTEKEEALPDVYADPEEELYVRQLDQAITAAMRGDPGLCLVCKALKDGLRPAEIAEEYALDINTVRNAQKRLGRLVDKVIISLNKIPGDGHQ